MLKARVLPEPVRPRPSTSRPLRLSGSVATWIGNGAVMPLAERTSTRGAGTPSASKVVSVGRTVASLPIGTTAGAGTAAAVGARWVVFCCSPAGRAPRPRPPRRRRGRSSLLLWVDGDTFCEVIGSSTLEWPHGDLAESERGRTCALGRAGSSRRRDVGQPGAPRWRSLSPTSIPAAPDERGRRRYSLLNQR